MDYTIIGPLVSGGSALLVVAFGYGSLNAQNKALKEEVKHLSKRLETYVTREEFRALERHFNGMDAKLDRIIESLMKAGHQ